MALPELQPETRCLINGRLVEAQNGAQYQNINPATGESLGMAADAAEADVQAAIAAAHKAFYQGASGRGAAAHWSRAAGFRARCIRQLHAALRAHKEQLRAIVVAEAGACVSLTGFMHVDAPIEMLEYWAQRAEDFQTQAETQMAPTEFQGAPQRRLLRHEAAGVVAALTPWNVPLYLNLAKLGPALAAGCTVVLKPAPETPWSATHLGKLIAEQTEIPPGVINIVSAQNPQLGEVLTTDARVDLVSFTGSTATGRRVMACAAQTVKKVFLELGGKSAAIVLDDADLEAVLPGAAFTCVHSGQGCAITTRWLIPKARMAEAETVLLRAFANWNYGDPRDPKNLQGPQISARQQGNVLAAIARGKADGARLLFGGGKPGGAGFYVQPTLFVDVHPDSALAQEEIFGPVCSVIPYESTEDAVNIANNSIYGLSGAVYGAEQTRALAVARRMRTGSVGINGGMWFHEDSPFGGYKQSGLGRENGHEGLMEYCESKVIALPG